MSLTVRLATKVSVTLQNKLIQYYYIKADCSYLLRVDKILTAKLISCAKMGSCVGAVTFTSAFAMLLVTAIVSVSFNSLMNKVRFVA